MTDVKESGRNWGGINLDIDGLRPHPVHGSSEITAAPAQRRRCSFNPPHEICQSHASSHWSPRKLA
jgi:hypothetical protein